MSNLVIGSKPGVGPILKIMKDDADDPFTTPNGDYGKFIFNSEVQKVGYIEKILEIAYDFTTYPAAGGTVAAPKRYYYPSGTGFFDCEAMIESYAISGVNYQQWILFTEFFGMSYMPLVEFRGLPASGNLDGPFVEGRTSAVTSIGYVYSYPAYSCALYIAAVYSGSGTAYNHRSPCYRLVFNTTGSAYPKYIASVFNLPADGTSIPDYTATPSSGQEVIRIDNTIARIALPGRDVSDADPNHYILHEDKIPAKILASGEVAVALGGTAAITTAIPMTGTTYMDFHARKTSASTMFHPPYISGNSSNEDLSFTYSISGNTVTITNASSYAITIRYAVCAADTSAHSSGGGKILYKDNDGTRDFVQIKRPGSSDTSPSLNDIMIDTRLSYLPILAEGFLDYSTDFTSVASGNRYKGEKSATISFANPDGLLPLVKCGSIFAGAGTLLNNSSQLDPLAVWAQHKIGYGGSYDNRCDGASTWVEIVDATNVNLYAAGGNPFFYSGGGTDAYKSAMLGLRYYIFGLPQSL